MVNGEEIVGVFLGLQSSTYEYIAEIIAPYQSGFRPKINSFMLIDNIDEFLVARVMDYVPRGELTSFMGEKWLSDVALTPEAIGQDIKTKKIRYRVKIKLLGSLDKSSGDFTPGVKDIPHITSKAVKPSTETIRKICSQALQDQAKGPKIGTYWLDNEIDIHFDLTDLVSKRTFIFARAGYGKSNLMKVIASNWNNDFGSLIIFDPEGEYAFTDNKNRPGIMDEIPAILITNRREHAGKKNVHSGLKFNLKDFSPEFIIPIIIPETKKEFIFFSKLMSMKQPQWNELVDQFHSEGWGADRKKLKEIIEGASSNTKEEDFQPIINNLTSPIKQLHDPNSKLLSVIEKGVEKGFVIIIDISLMDSVNALRLSSLIVGHFFNKNQRHFTGGTEELKKAVFVVEEAQSVLGTGTRNTRFIELAKEGRKYQLGGIFITQQPGSIPQEILSQADNFFVFHLLSKSDLNSLKNANAHYSEDILTQILSEPTKGKAYMWTSNQPFVLPVKTENFEKMAKPNEGEKIQQSSLILSEILDEIITDDEIYNSVLEKLRVVKDSLPEDTEDKKLTVDIFRELNDQEKIYCRKKGYIQEGYNGEFAITFNFLRELKKHLSCEKENDEESGTDTVSKRQSMSLEGIL